MPALSLNDADVDFDWQYIYVIEMNNNFCQMMENN